MKTIGIKDKHYCDRCGADLSTEGLLKAICIIDGAGGSYEHQFECRRCSNYISIMGTKKTAREANAWKA